MSVDPRDLRAAFGRFMTGVTVVTTRSTDGTPLGFTANSFTSVSLNPPLLLVCPGKFLNCYEAFSSCSSFAVSVLAEAQEDVSNTFASFRGDRFAHVAHSLDCHDVPVIDGAVAQFSCAAERWMNAGDHGILIGQVVDFRSTDRPGLGYHGGQYFSLGLERAARDGDGRQKTGGVIIQCAGSVLLEHTPDGYRPPQVNIRPGEGLSQAIQHHLAELGVDAEIGPVFSVFDDPATDTQYAYLLATAHVPDQGAKAAHPTPLEGISFDALPAAHFASPAIADMLGRFAREARARNFTLYLGDTEVGETHTIRERD